MKLIGKWVEMVCFVELMPIAAAICQRKIFRYGFTTQTQWMDMVEIKGVW